MSSGRVEPAPDPGTGRVEAFSDGVMAIAITLLTLNLAVPTDGELGRDGLLGALLDRWPNYLAYLAAFLMIGIIWLNHRALVDKVRRFDHVLLWLNLFLLLTVAVLPFPTAILAAYVREGGPNAATAASFFGLVASAMALSWVLTWRHLRDNPELLEASCAPGYASREVRRAGYGFAVYAGSVVVAVLLPLIAVIGYVGIAVFYGIAREGVGRDLDEAASESGPADTPTRSRPEASA